MNNSNVLVARMGQMQVAQSGETLKAIMGSCVGIGILWRKRGIFALSHCLLGNAPQDRTERSAKYVSDAIPMMLDALQVETRRDRRVVRKLAHRICRPLNATSRKTEYPSGICRMRRIMHRSCLYTGTRVSMRLFSFPSWWLSRKEKPLCRRGRNGSCRLFIHWLCE